MNLSFFPKNLFESISRVNLDKVYEIRLRKSFPIKIFNNNKYYYLSKEGLTLSKNDSIICKNNDIDEIMDNLTQRSIYAFNDKIKNGFITVEDGIRIGLSGQCVFDKENILTINNFSSLNIRIPHFVLNCSNEIFNQIYDNRVLYNSVILSPPFHGKTTLLKDLINKFNQLNIFNILVIDERGEFINCNGENIDIISFSNKEYAFNYAIRSLSPDIVITDELCNKRDIDFVNNAINSGVKIIASSHSLNKNEFISRFNIENRLFDKYFILENEIGIFGRLIRVEI